MRVLGHSQELEFVRSPRSRGGHKACTTGVLASPQQWGAELVGRASLLVGRTSLPAEQLGTQLVAAGTEARTTE